MKLAQIQVGRPRRVEWRGEVVETAIFKTPVAGPVAVTRLNLAGDKQADLTVHGGTEKAVYAYPSEHYAWWREQLQGAELAWGAFGENFTTEGVLETSLAVGDRLRIGSAEFVVTQPRQPCYKLAIRFGRADVIKRFVQSGRSGFYLAVVKEGEVAAGDAIEVTSRDENGVTVAQVFELFVSKTPDQELLKRASQVKALPEEWRQYFRDRIEA